MAKRVVNFSKDLYYTTDKKGAVEKGDMNASSVVFAKAGVDVAYSDAVKLGLVADDGAADAPKQTPAPAAPAQVTPVPDAAQDAHPVETTETPA